MPKLNIARFDLEELEELPSRPIKVDTIHRIYSDTRAYRADCRSVIDYDVFHRQLIHHIGKHINEFRSYLTEKYTGYKLMKVVETMKNYIDIYNEMAIRQTWFRYVLDANGCIQPNKNPSAWAFEENSNPVVLDMEGGLFMAQKNGVWYRALPAPRESFFQSKHFMNLIMGTPHYFKEMHWRRDAMEYNTAPREGGSYFGPFKGIPGMEHKYVKNLELATVQESVQANDRLRELGIKMTDISALPGYRRYSFNF